MTFYTDQEAQATITNLAGVPFGINLVDDFMQMSANQAGLAGLIASASVFAMTGLIWKGETQGFSAAMQAVGGAFKGNVDKTAQESLKDAALEHEIDEKYEKDLRNSEAESWLSSNGFSTRDGVSALATYQAIQQGSAAIGSGLASKALYEGNMGKANMQNFIKGNEVTATQNVSKTAGIGNNIASVQSAGDVSFQDGQVMAESINATDRLRNFDEKTHSRELGKNYDVGDVGAGMALSQFAKDQGMALSGHKLNEGFDKNDALYQKSVDALADTKNKKSAFENEMSKDDFLNMGNEAMANRNSIGNRLNANANRIDELNEKKNFSGEGLNAFEENELSQLQKEQSSLSNEWDSANNLIDNSMKNMQSARTQSEINKDIAEADKQIASAQNALDSFDQGKSIDVVSALVANSTLAAASQIASGEGLLRTDMFDKNTGMMNDGTEAHNYLRGIEGHSLQKASKEIGFGQDIAMGKTSWSDISSVATEDGGVEASAIRHTRKNRDVKGYKTTDNKDVKWNVDDVGKGQAMAQVGKEMDSIGAVMSLDETDGLKNFLKGKLHLGQKGANTTIGEGEYREDLENGNIKVVGKDGKMRTATVEDSMVASKIGAKAKEKTELNDNTKLRNKFGANLDQMGSFERAYVENQEAIDNAKANNSAVDANIAKAKKLFGNDIDTSALEKEYQDVPPAITGTKKESISFDKMVANEASSILAGRMGNAIAYDEIGNKTGNAFNTMASNAMYGAESQALSTKAKLDAQGGIDKAVKVDTTEAKLKAATQMDVLDKNLKEAGASKGLESSMDDLTKAIDKLATTQGSLAGEKTTSDIANVEAKKDAGIFNTDGTVSQLGKEALAIKPGEDATSLAKKVEMGKKGGEAIEQVAEKMKTAGRSKEAIDKAIAPFKNEDGTFKQGQEFWNTIAAQKQGVFSGSNALMLGDGVMASGGFSDGKFTGKISEGISTIRDNSETTKQGQSDDGVIKDKLKSFLASKYGDETATELMAGWNQYGEVIKGAGALTAGGALYQKMSNSHLASQRPKLNTTTENINADIKPTNSNITNPFNVSNGNYTINQENTQGLSQNMKKNSADLVNFVNNGGSVSQFEEIQQSKKEAFEQKRQTNNDKIAGYDSQINSVDKKINTIDKSIAAHKEAMDNSSDPKVKNAMQSQIDTLSETKESLNTQKENLKNEKATYSLDNNDLDTKINNIDEFQKSGTSQALDADIKHNSKSAKLKRGVGAGLKGGIYGAALTAAVDYAMGRSVDDNSFTDLATHTSDLIKKNGVVGGVAEVVGEGFVGQEAIKNIKKHPFNIVDNVVQAATGFGDQIVGMVDQGARLVEATYESATTDKSFKDSYNKEAFITPSLNKSYNQAKSYISTVASDAIHGVQQPTTFGASPMVNNPQPFVQHSPSFAQPQQPIATVNPSSGQVNWQSRSTTLSGPSGAFVNNTAGMGQQEVNALQLKNDSTLIQSVKDSSDVTSDLASNIELYY